MIREKLMELRKEGKTALISFLTIGYPRLEYTPHLIDSLINGGTDIIELGIPFSDPIADGPVIQHSSQIALKNKASVSKCFKIIRKIRKTHNIPIVILTYYNLIYRRGVERFLKEAAKSGVNGVLAADLPIDEAGEFEKACKKFGVQRIFLIAPNTPDKRVKEIALHSDGFLYLIAHYGITGAKERLQTLTKNTLKRLKALTDVPICVGFGISKPEHVRELAECGADGVIIGSAYIDAISKCKNLDEMKEKIEKMAHSLKGN